MENAITELNKQLNINKRETIKIPNIYERIPFVDGPVHAIGHFKATNGYFR